MHLTKIPFFYQRGFNEGTNRGKQQNNGESRGMDANDDKGAEDGGLWRRLIHFFTLGRRPDSAKELEHEIQELLEEGEEQGLISPARRERPYKLRYFPDFSGGITKVWPGRIHWTAQDGQKSGGGASLGRIPKALGGTFLLKNFVGGGEKGGKGV